MLKTFRLFNLYNFKIPYYALDFGRLNPSLYMSYAD